jgi:enterochelin esterase-like enzyme
MTQFRQLAIILLIISCFVVPVVAQEGYVVNTKIHSVALEGNLVGDSPSRNVSIYLPPGYDEQLKKRYPVVYLLHGFNGNAGNRRWFGQDSIFNSTTINKLISSGMVEPMIIVMPDGSNKFGGSMYTNSITTGNWEDFIVYDLTKFIDTKYRSIPKPESRGIAGHSMGGYGAIKIAMKHPDIFLAVYGSSPCCLTENRVDYAKSIVDGTLSIKHWEDINKAKFHPRVLLATSAAWSPNPVKPPFFADLPFDAIDDTISINEQAKARRLANIPAWMADQYRTNLQQLHAIAFDAGTKEAGNILDSSQYFADMLKRMKVQYSFEVFEGGHNNKVRERIETKILPFFSRALANK